MLPDSDGLSLRGGTEGATPTKVPAKVREIITRNLSPDGWGGSPAGAGSSVTPGVDQLREENRMLQVRGEGCEK